MKNTYDTIVLPEGIDEKSFFEGLNRLTTEEWSKKSNYERTFYAELLAEQLLKIFLATNGIENKNTPSIEFASLEKGTLGSYENYDFLPKDSKICISETLGKDIAYSHHLLPTLTDTIAHEGEHFIQYLLKDCNLAKQTPAIVAARGAHTLNKPLTITPSYAFLSLIKDTLAPNGYFRMSYEKQDILYYDLKHHIYATMPTEVGARAAGRRFTLSFLSFIENSPYSCEELKKWAHSEIEKLEKADSDYESKDIQKTQYAKDEYFKLLDLNPRKILYFLQTYENAEYSDEFCNKYTISYREMEQILRFTIFYLSLDEKLELLEGTIFFGNQNATNYVLEAIKFDKEFDSRRAEVQSRVLNILKKQQISPSLHDYIASNFKKTKDCYSENSLIHQSYGASFHHVLTAEQLVDLYSSLLAKEQFSFANELYYSIQQALKEENPKDKNKLIDKMKLAFFDAIDKVISLDDDAFVAWYNTEDSHNIIIFAGNIFSDEEARLTLDVRLSLRARIEILGNKKKIEHLKPFKERYGKRETLNKFSSSYYGFNLYDVQDFLAAEDARENPDEDEIKL